MRRYRAWAQRRQRTGPAAILSAARATIRRKKFCLVATSGRDGISARVLQPFPPDPDLTLWFGTSASSRKVAELGADPRATVVYQDDSKAACVVCAGRIDVLDAITVREQRFMPPWYAFWPEGPASEDFVVLRFVPDRLEVWDGSRGITPEPFGLRSACLTRRDGAWVEA
jgi:general stress protein 26